MAASSRSIAAAQGAHKRPFQQSVVVFFFKESALVPPKDGWSALYQQAKPQSLSLQAIKMTVKATTEHKSESAGDYTMGGKMMTLLWKPLAIKIESVGKRSGTGVPLKEKKGLIHVSIKWSQISD